MATERAVQLKYNLTVRNFLTPQNLKVHMNEKNSYLNVSQTYLIIRITC